MKSKKANAIFIRALEKFNHFSNLYSTFTSLLNFTVNLDVRNITKGCVKSLSGIEFNETFNSIYLAKFVHFVNVFTK